VSGWTSKQLAYRITKVQDLGRITALRPRVLAEVMDPASRDQVGFQRIRRLFALPTPPVPRLTRSLQENTRTALRVLTAVGPATTAELLEAVVRTHRYVRTAVPTPAQLERGLRFVGAVSNDATGTWTAPTGSEPMDKDAALIRAAAARSMVLTRVELLEVLHAAGYLAATVKTPTIPTHPLIRQVDRNKYVLSAGRRVHDGTEHVKA
jgi:hypothetical protein